MKGPWDTKSGGLLNALLALNASALSDFLNFTDTEFVKLPIDIRGLRCYTVSNLEKGKVGANEWHKFRNEIVFVTQGKINWIVEDTEGNKATYTLLPNQGGLLNPSYVLHTYEVLEDNTTILVLANTLYVHEEPSTHDTYSRDDFIITSRLTD